MMKSFISPKWIIFVLCFLVCTTTFINGLPNVFSYSAPKTSEDDVGTRSLSYDDLTPSEDIEDLNEEYDFNDLDDDVEDQYKFLTNNKRNPNSLRNKSFQNFAGFYMIDDNGTVKGTKRLAECVSKGIFAVGRTANGPFFRNLASGKYLAIDTSGGVYMSPNENKDTRIYTIPGDNVSVYLYRIVTLPGGQKKRLYLDISPHSRTVREGSTSNTTEFKVRLGTKTC